MNNGLKPWRAGEWNDGLETKPMLAFTLCYVAAHLALDLLDEQEAETILVHCEEHLAEDRHA